MKRVTVVRGAILVLLFAALVLWWRPWAELPDCIRCAARNGSLVMTRYYLLRGEDVNEPAKFGFTALMEAAIEGHLEVAKLLVKKGANVNAVDEDGNTALMWAAFKRREDVGLYLLAHGAEMNHQNKDGETALMGAMRSSCVGLGRQLVAAGADINLEDKLGSTALMKAGRAGLGDMVQFLKKQGAVKTSVFLADKYADVAKPISPAQRWALACAALTVQVNGDSHLLLGSRPLSHREYGREFMRMWGVENREQTLELLDWLRDEGYRGKLLAQHRNLQRAAGAHTALLAWDYCALVNVASLAYLAGCLNEEEAWHRIMPAARALQANYDSWREMGEDFLLAGRLSKRDLQVEYQYVFDLLTNEDDLNSPWNKNPWSLDLSKDQ